MRRTRTLPTIKESPAELRQLMAAESNKKMHRRLHALLLIALGEAKNKTHLAALMDVQLSTIGLWLKAYERDGLTGLRPLKTRTPGRSALDLQGPEPGSLLVEIEKRLSDPENCPKDWKRLWRDLRRDFGLDMSFPAFYKAATRRFPNARAKVARPRHVKKAKNADEDFKKN